MEPAQPSTVHAPRCGAHGVARTLRRIAAAVAFCAVPLGAGWLASGSCVAVACYEDCDPCFQQCKCSNNCPSQLGGEQGLRIGAHESSVVVQDEQGFVRVLDVLDGPVVGLSDGGGLGPAPAPSRVAAFARRVLDVNAEFFTAQRAPDWRLDAVHAFDAGTVVQFHLEPGACDAPRANSVTLHFDANGRLVEATHAVDRNPIPSGRH